MMRCTKTITTTKVPMVIGMTSGPGGRTPRPMSMASTSIRAVVLLLLQHMPFVGDDGDESDEDNEDDGQDTGARRKRKANVMRAARMMQRAVLLLLLVLMSLPCPLSHLPVSHTPGRSTRAEWSEWRKGWLPGAAPSPSGAPGMWCR